jgi:hypothetical protein
MGTALVFVIKSFVNALRVGVDDRSITLELVDVRGCIIPFCGAYIGGF